MPTHTVKQGDCISSIAANAGFLWSTVWDHPNNSALKTERKDPNTLLPGDDVFVPELEQKVLPRASDSKHTFTVPSVPAKLNVRFLVGDKPRSGIDFRLFIDNVMVKEGQTDGDGYVKASILPTVETGKIVLIEDQNNEEHYPFTFGSLDPIDTEEGVKERLINLGFDVSDLPTALGEFQKKYELSVSNSIDDVTKTKLKEVFGQ